ncbi:MAG TPA: CAP domain-containing protein [Chloroflexia bacterium]|nr:CAP domain-containing protein [Chloroflexia bacterium]
MSRNPFTRTLTILVVIALSTLVQACDTSTSTSTSATVTSKPASRTMPPAAKATAVPGGIKGNLGVAPTPDGCQAKDNAALEAEVIVLVNAERAKQNPALPPLKGDPKLAAAARAHSADMACNDHFDHTGTNGSSAGDRIAAMDYAFSTWGENIAWGQTTAAEVMDSWMNSEGHRANILNPDFTQIGVSDMALPDGAPLWTQVFATPQQ